MGTKRKCTEAENRRLLHDLTERVKELTFLHGAARVLQQEWADTEKVLRQLAELLPPAFQYPSATAARVQIGDIEAATPNFTASRTVLRTDFTTVNLQQGSIEVVYIKDRPPEAGELFLVEEHALIYTLTDMLRTAYDRWQAEQQLKASGEWLRALTARLASAREEEGIRIARELHDELGSSLTSLRWDLESLDKVLSKSIGGSRLGFLREKIASMIRLTETTVSAVRRISSELRPSLLDDLGLVEAIEWQAEQFQARTAITCLCNCSLDNLCLNKEQKTAVFRIFQEALTNVLRHAQATRVDIQLKEEAGEFILTITDNGQGITEAQKSALQSIGLLGMRERAHLVGGRININGVRGKGTVVTVLVPTSSPG